MTWTVVVNPKAGRTRGGRSLEVVAAVTEAIRHGLDAEVVVADSPDDARRHATTAAAAGHDLVAAGGDGTVGMIAGIAADHGVRFAVLPIGSGNDFAATIGVPDSIDGALALLDDSVGTDRTIDLGRVNGTWFCTVTATGFDSEASRWANGVTRLTGTALYVAAVLRTLATYRPHPMRVTVDGDVHELRAWMVSVGNGTRYGGGMHITPEARLDDGVFDVCAIGPVSRVRFLANFPKVFGGRHLGVDGVTTWRGRTVHVESLDASVPIEVFADGDRVGPLPGTMECVAAALTVRVAR